MGCAGGRENAILTHDHFTPLPVDTAAARDVDKFSPHPPSLKFVFVCVCLCLFVCCCPLRAKAHCAPGACFARTVRFVGCQSPIAEFPLTGRSNQDRPSTRLQRDGPYRLAISANVSSLKNRTDRAQPVVFWSFYTTHFVMIPVLHIFSEMHPRAGFPGVPNS